MFTRRSKTPNSFRYKADLFVYVHFLYVKLSGAHIHSLLQSLSIHRYHSAYYSNISRPEPSAAHSPETWHVPLLFS